METLGRALSPLRFACHGLQMGARTSGRWPPSGRVAVAALFQCGDEIPPHPAPRLPAGAARAPDHPDVADAGRALWQTDPAWQPSRRAIEKLLVTYDWAEALVALNVCLKPVDRRLFLRRLAALADRSGAHFDAQILRSLFEDCAWHRRWTEALSRLPSPRPANRDVVARWIDAWRPAVEAMTAQAATSWERAMRGRRAGGRDDADPAGRSAGDALG